MSFGRLFPAGRVVALAHRGGARLYPENTLAAFDHAVALGVDGLECDVRLSSDGVPVVVHDDSLDRTTDATGPVRARSAAELARVDAGARFGESEGFPFRGAGFGVPRLDDLIDRHLELPFVVEIKGDDPAAVLPVLSVLRRGRRRDRFSIGGFSEAVLAAARALGPEYPTSASRDEVIRAIRRSYLRLPPKRTGYAVFQVPVRVQGRPVFRASFVRTAVRAGVPVQAWIVDAEEEMRRLVAWGVTGIISDRPDVAVRVARTLRA